MIRRNQFHDLFYTLGIELVENIVEQQDRRCIALFPQKIVLGQFQGDQVSLALSLRAYAFHGILAQHHVHVVPMYAPGGISQYQVSVAVGFQLRQQCALGKMGFVNEIGRFVLR